MGNLFFLFSLSCLLLFSCCCSRAILTTRNDSVLGARSKSARGSPWERRSIFQSFFLSPRPDDDDDCTPTPLLVSFLLFNLTPFFPFFSLFATTPTATYTHSNNGFPHHRPRPRRPGARRHCHRFPRPPRKEGRTRRRGGRGRGGRARQGESGQAPEGPQGQVCRPRERGRRGRHQGQGSLMRREME